MLVRWNLTSHIQEPRKSEALIISVGKSGRTWLRVMINKYLSLVYDVDFTVNRIHEARPGIPRFHYTHEAWEHYTKANLTRRALGKYIIPDSVLLKKKVVLMYRDPRDMIVSYYFHRQKRTGSKPVGSMSEFIRNPEDGLPRVIEVMNTWRSRLYDHDDCLWLSYEELKKEPVREFSKVVEFLIPETVDREMIESAVDFGSFDKMKQMEQSGGFGSKILKPSDPGDTDSFKVRRGKIGGYVDYFSEEELRWMDLQVGGLDERYGYGPTV